ncbi:type II toxin-antitoxin system RelE/ParE family toxin [Patescibacteria group bacterium]|nr:type II toxin-antitoxin system RelE/ParE family toxin [Patescibacteria group bacterium]MBP9709741.1 type II toxin-antitoxin system RelE/ParE family toxin [Patescibacteria group bacterium]
MTNRIQKVIAKLSSKEQERVEKIIEQVLSGDLANLDIKKLQNKVDIYRVRKGDVRIIYQIINGEILILAVERRSERTYQDI